MTTYATCGHALAEGESGEEVYYKASASRILHIPKVLRGKYCKECVEHMRKRGAVLETEAARQAWLEGK